MPKTTTPATGAQENGESTSNLGPLWIAIIFIRKDYVKSYKLKHFLIKKIEIYSSYDLNLMIDF